MSRYLRAFGRATFLVGVNYWSRAGGPRMWESARFDAQTVEAEIAHMRALGLNACRAFLLAPTFMPSPPRLDAGALSRLRFFADACTRERIALLPTFLVGHMSGENFDFPGQNGRSLYRDPKMLRWQRELVRAASGALRDAPAISAWVLSNEMPLWGGAGSRAEIAAWTRLLTQEARRAGGGLAVGTGDGVMGLRGGPNGFDVESLAELVDYIGPHVYGTDSDALRHALFVEYAIRSLEHLRKPVLLEEFGCSSAHAGEVEQAAYWRETMHTALSLGAAGALGWCMSDFDLAAESPYRHHAGELRFGIVRADGSEKAAAAEVRGFSKLVGSLEIEELEVERPRAALVRPSYLDRSYPFSSEDRGRMTRTLLQAYTLTRKAGLQASVVPETHSLAEFDLILVPATQKLLAPTWEHLAERAAAGAVVYWSYFGGDHDFHQGMWCHCFERLTGCRHRLRYGVPNLPPPRVRLRADAFALEASTGAGASFARAFLPIEAESAEVLARDDAGRPALVRHALGGGSVYFLAYPWEYYLGEQMDINESDGSHVLYTFLSSATKISARYAGSRDGRVQTHVMHGSREDVVWAMNRSWDQVAGDIDAPGGKGPFAPKEIRVLRVPRGG